jgi:hypothetical protein
LSSGPRSSRRLPGLDHDGWRSRTRNPRFNGGGFLLTLAIILFVAWLIGLALFELAGTAIRLLIVLSVVALVLRLAWGGSARADLGPSGPRRGGSTSPAR